MSSLPGTGGGAHAWCQAAHTRHWQTLVSKQCQWRTDQAGCLQDQGGASSCSSSACCCCQLWCQQSATAST